MLKRALNLKRHIAIPSDRLDDRQLTGPHETWLRPDEPVERVEEELDGLQGVVFFERPEWHPELVPTAKRMAVKTVSVPNWEWFCGHDPKFRQTDFYACPSRWTVQVVRQYGYTNASHVTWPMDVNDLPERNVSGPARLFLHNAGLVDVQDRKGTADTIRAFCKVRRPDIRLLVRLQKKADLPGGDDRVEIRVGNLDDHADLYREGDCAIQPSKMEGVGFMVLEPFCCGLPTITLDYPPMNEYVEDRRMLARPQWFRRRAFSTAWVPHAHLRIPRRGDLADRIAWCADHDLGEISKANRAAALERFDRKRMQIEWATVLQGVLDR